MLALLKTGWSAFKGFLPNPWLIVVVFIALCTVGLYGYHSGSTAMETAKNLEIQKIVNSRNMERGDWNTRLANLEIKTFDQSLYFKNLQITSAVERERIVTEYVTKWKTQPANQDCGLPADAISVLNSLQEVRK
ncbi:hypothetical protein [Achromobacter phage Motura]|uniref:Uncharacterized protein n=1 Tax=Achromobacter phage Motura TaxID=2591403 RepID=A0A514CSH2_9CAUD|nr:hypothetical protein H1O15_gp013 [Achromobacter phage Motura]QDH83422.1 hypothetical protein [Achromobacter phage Motura]